jgi:hypothetical protein
MQPRDLEIVRLVSEHRVISSDDLQLLITGSDQGILRRLQRLFHGGFLDRPRSQRQRGNQPIVYALGQRGAQLVAHEPGVTNKADWSDKNRQLTAHYLEHALMISRFQTALRYACHKSQIVSLDRWLPDGFVRDSVRVENDAGVQQRIPVAPDAFFVLRVSDDDHPGRIHVFLEADRSTMTVERFLTKLRGYYGYWRSGQAEKRLGMKKFLVATVARSEERATNLLRTSQQVAERGLRMFLFTCESEYLPATRRRILEPIWRGNDGPRSLLE